MVLVGDPSGVVKDTLNSSPAFPCPEGVLPGSLLAQAERANVFLVITIWHIF